MVKEKQIVEISWVFIGILDIVANNVKLIKIETNSLSKRRFHEGRGGEDGGGGAGCMVEEVEVMGGRGVEVEVMRGRGVEVEKSAGRHGRG